MKTITWTAPANDNPLIAGKTFAGGRTDTYNGERVVRFDSPMLPGRQKLCAKTASRHDLAKLADEYDAEQRAEQDALEAKRAEQYATDKPLLDAMEDEAARLRGKIPADSIMVAITREGDCDGDDILRYTAEGVDLPWDAVTVHGWACAVRPGAMGAFAKRCVASIPLAKLDKIKVEIEAKAASAMLAKAEKEADRAAKFADAKATGKPVELRRWTEERRAREDGEWGDYVFVCSELAMPDGSTKTTATNTY